MRPVPHSSPFMWFLVTVMALIPTQFILLYSAVAGKPYQWISNLIRQYFLVKWIVRASVFYVYSQCTFREHATYQYYVLYLTSWCSNVLVAYIKLVSDERQSKMIKQIGCQHVILFGKLFYGELFHNQHCASSDRMRALFPAVFAVLALYTPIIPSLIPRERVAISRCGIGRNGRQINLATNHFKVSVNAPDAVFFQYNVLIKSENNQEVEGRRFRRKVMDKLYRTPTFQLDGKCFAFDGGKALYTVGSLPLKKLKYSVELDEAAVKRSGSPDLIGMETFCIRSKTFKVKISFAARIPMKPIALALNGLEAENTGDALRVLDTILRQHAAKRGCLLVRQSFFHDDFSGSVSVGEGVTACRGFHSSFRTTQGGLSLNMDQSSTMILTPGPVLEFLLATQNVSNPCAIDWEKASKMLKNLRVKTRHNNMEFKIIGLSEQVCNDQRFLLKKRNGDSSKEETVQITVYDYFQSRKIPLTKSRFLPCLDVGKVNGPIYLPLELCSLLSLQRYTKALSSKQRVSLGEKSKLLPHTCMQIVKGAVRDCCYGDDPMFKPCGISIEGHSTVCIGRVLGPPKLIFGRREGYTPRGGRWNFNGKKLYNANEIKNWAIVNFSTHWDMKQLSQKLISCGASKGMSIRRPLSEIEEDLEWSNAGPVERVEKMFETLCEQVEAKGIVLPDFILCLLPEKKCCNIYGPWKKKNLHEMGIITQCLSPTEINDQYLTNVLLKINSKLGGKNSLLADEHIPNLPHLKDTPTMILGMDVSHGSPGQSDAPSIAAVVGSTHWPLFSTYRASVRTQLPNMEMIDSLFKLEQNEQDVGIIRELLLEFFESTRGRKPEQIIIFRDGVSESQFPQILNIELEQIVKAVEYLGCTRIPKITLIVAQKNHHTKLIPYGSTSNPPPGTVVDTQIVHPRNYDFYMCAHKAEIGTTRPTHYHVLLDEIGFSADELQNIVHSLCYVYQRGTTATSIVAPICYAHLAAAQMRQLIKFDASSDSSPSHGVTSAGSVPVALLPSLHNKVKSSMFFC
ncbi:hypothetical protein AQUCO_00201245v1 [Aquilegia coerulea]|uniref:Piwi domain-containing protein n=2 Tax=Aquilegia coerulea TaxID=218851 RepID=A0A2G5F6Y6_AQUCA|nr:hypothetical protein AQUCO_00201245v1 [Aquilegia coerulea]